jgi:hypothetical protein
MSAEPRTSCATQLPWYEHPFKLISWLEMNQFSAAVYHQIGVLLGSTEGALHARANRIPEVSTDKIAVWMDDLSATCATINLAQSARVASRIASEIRAGQREDDELAIKIRELSFLISGEMAAHLFLWVPSHRAGWYEKKAETIAGKLWFTRFKSTIPEIEEASKCYAVGRYTAASFHLMRATEAGTKALGMAIGLTPRHPGWKCVFDEVWAQYKNKKPRHAVWATHEASLVDVSGDLRTISHVWRNDLAHFVDTYGEEDAKEMFTIVPVFMRHLASMIDEAGNLYP